MLHTRFGISQHGLATLLTTHYLGCGSRAYSILLDFLLVVCQVGGRVRAGSLPLCKHNLDEKIFKVIGEDSSASGTEMCLHGILR